MNTKQSTYQDEIHMTTSQLIEAHGYQPETHNVWTEDGYCLTVHRVLPSKISHDCSMVERHHSELQENGEALSNNGKTKRPPVLITHGLLSSSADWVLLGPKKALAYFLCDEGYDVWLANARGNAYSKKHKRFTTKDREFWNFSWHEIGYYDLPALIDHILEQTGFTELYYIGYSQGTTTFYVMMSEKPEYNQKIRGMINMAPVVFLSNQRSPLIKLVVRFYSLMEWGSSYCNIHQWFPRNRLQARAMMSIYRNVPCSVTKGFCIGWFYLIAGFGSDQLDESMVPLIFGHFPAGSSAKQIIHYSQSVLSGSFCHFDYGTEENVKLYGTMKPPKYQIEKVKCPVAVFYSENDFLTDPADVKKLVDRLPNVIETRKVEYTKFNHIDYLWGKDAKTLLYNTVLATLKRFR